MKCAVFLAFASIAACSAANLQPRIIDGKLAKIRDHPWLVSLREEGSYKCGAGLIKPDKALTAAHCYDPDIAARSYSVYAGSKLRSSNGHSANVRRIYVHPQFSIDSMQNDLAVVWLLESLPIGNLINPIPMANLNEELPGGSIATVSGWGRTTTSVGCSEELYQTDLPVLSSNECASIYGRHINAANVICAGYVNGGGDATDGDSGSPLVFNNKLYGIVSLGTSSANPKYVGVYTRVAAYRGWIDEAMTEEYTPIYNDGH